jgi:hypothetical protein
LTNAQSNNSNFTRSQLILFCGCDFVAITHRAHLDKVLFGKAMHKGLLPGIVDPATLFLRVCLLQLRLYPRVQFFGREAFLRVFQFD